MNIINQNNNFQNSENGTGQNFDAAIIENQTNITVISNKSISKKLNKDIAEFKAHSLANYSPHWIILKKRIMSKYQSKIIKEYEDKGYLVLKTIRLNVNGYP